MMTASILPDWFGEWLDELLHTVAGKIVDWFFDLILGSRVVGEEWLASLQDAVASAFPSLAGVVNSPLIAKINYFFPLSEAVSMMIVYLSLWGLVLTYRIIKSWVPATGS